MKNKKIILFFLLAFSFMIGLNSCKKESFNINQDPNNATDSTVAYNTILPSALDNTARIVATPWGWLQNYLGYWSRSGTYAPSTEEETYQITTNFQSGIWSQVYDNLYDYELMRKSAEVSGAFMYEGIARIMKAHDFAILVDLYGNVPYSDAFKGSTTSPTPKYDNGFEIYKDLFRQIDTAIDHIKNADNSKNAEIATDDVMFGLKNFPSTGSSNSVINAMKVRWAKFGNTLKLRMLTKFMNGGVEFNSSGSIGSIEKIANNYNVQSEINAIETEGSGFLDFDAEVNPGYQADKGNPFFNSYVEDNSGVATGNSVYYKANEFAVPNENTASGGGGFYQWDADTREGAFYTTVPNTNRYRGVTYGSPASTDFAASTLSGIGSGVYRGVDKPQWIITAAESYFLQAECANRGYLTSVDPKGSLETGILSSFLSLGLTSQDYNDYYAYNSDPAVYVNPDVIYDAPEGSPDGAMGGLYTIITQKWFALNAIAPFEVWSDYRRIGISDQAGVNHFIYGGPSAFFIEGPRISQSPSNTATEIPRRLLYPQREYLYNAANVGAQPSSGAYPFNPVFWDVNN